MALCRTQNEQGRQSSAVAAKAKQAPRTQEGSHWILVERQDAACNTNLNPTENTRFIYFAAQSYALWNQPKHGAGILHRLH